MKALTRAIPVVALAVAWVLPTVADVSDDVGAAERTAQSWLSLTDAGAYGEAWEGAAAVFRSSITKDGWINSITKARGPLGAMKSRRLRSAAFTHSLPHAPQGDYVVIQFDTEFDSLPQAIETITPAREADGSWKVSGYYIRKPQARAGS